MPLAHSPLKHLQHSGSLLMPNGSLQIITVLVIGYSFVTIVSITSGFTRTNGGVNGRELSPRKWWPPHHTAVPSWQTSKTWLYPDTGKPVRAEPEAEHIGGKGSSQDTYGSNNGWRLLEVENKTQNSAGSGARWRYMVANRFTQGDREKFIWVLYNILYIKRREFNRIDHVLWNGARQYRITIFSYHVWFCLKRILSCPLPF